MGPLVIPRVDLGTEMDEGRGSHLPPLHRCLLQLTMEGVIALTAAGRVAGHREALVFSQSMENTPC